MSLSIPSIVNAGFIGTWSPKELIEDQCVIASLWDEFEEYLINLRIQIYKKMREWQFDKCLVFLGNWIYIYLTRTDSVTTFILLHYVVREA